ncbi:UHRF1-binding protein 1-like isoform X1 [Sinocyclocheilus anshuiensis]|uniref:UHRF1-binding protein 1-like isoform X1 n=1 Tax=Sinocyclocheilus anshuiensis TaxID=1608454 RepID=UPI0007B8FABD|nr:PREDICTED: UHRF1-binding protein 1-like isoform X1 [Sinocyclocheilus anshuiensis]
MAGIIKKQILKHLSRFTKNLSPDKINLSTLKGEGQLSNLELDEEVLQNMLDLPTWLAVTRVYCNKAAIRIQWTKLKTSPICLFLDKVEVEMRTCEEPRPPNGPSPIAITAGQSEYGFAEKVVEGMSVIINSITIKVQARAFHASFELWQLQGCSLNPKWQKSDLRYTRITHPKRGEVLTFKEINWQSLRIEADAIESDEQDLGSTPLRLITNQGRIRIALKRRVKDCNVLASKLLFILDDLLWVLTDSQLKAIIHYAKSLSEAMEKSGQQRKSMAAETLQTAPPSPGIHSLWTEPPPPEAVGTPGTLAQYFDLHDVKESSYHTFISRLDLHICNDSSSDSDEAPPPGTQGAMQLTFRKLGCDYYPFHRPGDGCRHWERHCGAMESRAQWAAKLLQEFQRRVEDLGIPGPHSETNVSAKDSPAKKIKDGESLSSFSPERSQTSRRTSAAAPSSGTPLKSLRSSCMVIRVDDLDIHQVSTGGRHSKRTQSLLSCNRKSLHLPDNTPAIHLQFTEYYFPDNPGLPVPCSNLYAQLNGLQLCLDAPSVLWMTLFSRGLHKTLDQVKAFYHLQDSSKTDEHIDIRLDATQLKLIIPLESSILDHPDRPQSLSISLPQIILSNTRHAPHGSHSDLNSTYSSFSTCTFFHPMVCQPFPRDQSILLPLPSAFLQHCLENESLSLAHKRPSRSQDVWSVSLSRVTLDFEGARRGLRGKALPFVEPFAMSLWMCCPSAFKKDSHCSSIDADSKSPTGSSKQPLLDSLQGVNDVISSKVDQTEDLVNSPMASIHILAQSITPVKMWLNHYQFVALLRMKDYLARLAGDLTKDVQGLGQPEHKPSDPPSVCVSILMEVIELALLLPPATSEPVEEAHSPEETDSPSLTDSDLSPSHHAGEPGLLEDSGTGGNEDQEDYAEQEGSVEEACEAVEEGMDGPTGQDDEAQAVIPSSSPALSPGNPALLSRHSSTFSLEGELSSALNATKGVTKDALSASLDLTKGALSITKDAFSILSRGSGMTKLFAPQNKEQSARPEESGPSMMGNLRLQSMKQSPSQNSCDSAILESSLADDGMSIDSDISENFVILMDSESGVESLRPNGAGVSGSCVSPAPGTEGGSSADLSSSLSQSTEDIAQDMVSVLVLCLSRMGCLTEMRGEDIVVALEAQELVPKQLGNHKVTDLLAGLALTQAGSSSPSAPLSPGPQSLYCPPAAALRMEMGPCAGRHSPLSKSVGFMEMCLTGCKAELLASTLNTLGPFLEDELSADPQPMRLWLRDTAITLKDDGPRVYPTTPQPVPVLFSLDGIVLERLDDGILSLRPAQSQSGIETGGDKDRAGQSCFRAEEKNKSLESRLADVQSALEKALSDRERLLQEVMNHNPSFTL